MQPDCILSPSSCHGDSADKQRNTNKGVFSESSSKHLMLTSRKSTFSKMKIDRTINPVYLLNKPETSSLAGNPTGILWGLGVFISCSIAADCQGNHLSVASNSPWFVWWALRIRKSVTLLVTTPEILLSFYILYKEFDFSFSLVDRLYVCTCSTCSTSNTCCSRSDDSRHDSFPHCTWLC